MLLSLDSLKDVDKLHRILSATQLELALDRVIRHAADAPVSRTSSQLVNLLAALVALHDGLVEVSLRDSSSHGDVLESLIARDVLLILKIRGKEPVNDLELRLFAEPLGEVNQAVRVPRVAQSAAKLEVDAEGVAHAAEALVDHGSALWAEALQVVLVLVEAVARASGRIGVELVGRVLDRKGVGGRRVALLPDLLGSLDLLAANVAPGADCV